MAHLSDRRAVAAVGGSRLQLLLLLLLLLLLTGRSVRRPRIRRMGRSIACRQANISTPTTTTTATTTSSATEIGYQKEVARGIGGPFADRWQWQSTLLGNDGLIDGTHP